MKTETYTLPEYWASALINADASGLSDTEEQALNSWLEYAKPGYCLDCSEESFFTHWHDAIGYSLAGYCLEFTFGVITKMKNTIVVNGKRKVCRIFDFGENQADRYTIAFKGIRHPLHGMYYPYLASGDKPFHPQGFGQHGESQQFLTGKHLGKRVSFESLPIDVQTFILQSI